MTDQTLEHKHHYDIQRRRGQLVRLVEGFIAMERYGDLCTDEFINFITDCICRCFPNPTPDQTLDPISMLMSREQLMTTIESIIHGHWEDSFPRNYETPYNLDDRDALIKQLCDAVEENFPTTTPD